MNKTQKLKLIGLVCILSFALVFIGLNLLQAEEQGKNKPPDKGKPEPQSPLVLNPADIVTAESNAVRVWDCSIDAYAAGNPIWSTKTPGHFSVGVGDVDGDGLREIVVPEIKGTPRRGKKDNFKFFLNIYKEGVSGIWHSTEDYACLTGQVRHAQVMIADVDGIPGDEVILMTYKHLAIFKYVEGGNGDELFTMTFKTAEEDYSEIYHFVAVTAGNVIDGNGYAGDEIIVSAFDGRYSYGNGSVFILDKSLDIIEIYTIPDLLNTYLYSLCAADLNGDNVDEICATGSIYCGSGNGVLYQAKVFVWHWSGNSWNCSFCLIPGWETSVNMFPYLCLDAGELNGKPRIVVSANSGYQDYYLYIYNYDANQLSLSYPDNGGFGLFLPDADKVYDVEVGDVDGDTSNNEIVVAGTANVVTCFYLEVFDLDFDSYLDLHFDSLWRRIGEHRKEGRVFDTVIVK